MWKYYTMVLLVSSPNSIFSDLMLGAWNWPLGGCLHYGNQQILQTMAWCFCFLCCQDLRQSWKEMLVIQVKIVLCLTLWTSFPGGWDSKESAWDAGDVGSVPGWGRSLEKEMATHSSILAWRISWTEDPGGLQSMGSQRIGHNWATHTFTFFYTVNGIKN